ncbi:hypothetical protein C8J57DRAFT_1373598, partial [Mycena rebaudengoi]
SILFSNTSPSFFYLSSAPLRSSIFFSLSLPSLRLPRIYWRPYSAPSPPPHRLLFPSHPPPYSVLSCFVPPFFALFFLRALTSAFIPHRKKTQLCSRRRRRARCRRGRGERGDSKIQTCPTRRYVLPSLLPRVPIRFLAFFFGPYFAYFF